MIVAVTGATGLVGSHVVRALLRRGLKVRALVRRPDRLDVLSDCLSSVEFVPGDIEDPEALRALLREADAAVHAAALVAFHPRWRAQMRRVNVRGTACLVDVALQTGLKRLVHLSSVAALGLPEDEEPIDGALRFGFPAWSSYYGYTKYLAELEVYRGIAEGLPAVLLNPALVFGPGRIREGTGRLFWALHRGWIRCYPPGRVASVDARDVAEAVCLALEKGTVGRRYVLSAQEQSFRELLAEIAHALGRPVPERPIGAHALRWLGWIGEAWGWISPKPVGLTREIAQAACRTPRYDVRMAQEELGVVFRPFSETAADTVAHYRTTGQL
ncbi:MAG: NAD-dependent epimerase/dehydratase family protein [Bacteroidetes bacterium]|nr:NAD-dependent epimerase/dehydratase family protein [Rhodothermia bacterium]MCS7155988.1 NAD-dependent epimerase/dehydratase family protein [Bacteroidota bacterium]MCX7907676.1 NAD-dependent epimerase/dehydratase family protein [Bacteroidota bacterium]MDW8137805.1 NAD-dependent epimerase/dehydratase family protein [Bacteroidota bacterium]MDW8286344.1 NAD-dependent epimerase/dehydratase family protein [Bacteroidota bacterium]